MKYVDTKKIFAVFELKLSLCIRACERRQQLGQHSTLLPREEIENMTSQFAERLSW